VKRLSPEAARSFELEHDDLLFARSGATAGKAFRFTSDMGPACFAGYLIRFRFDKDRVLPEFVELWTQTAHYWAQIGESTIQATIQNISANRYLALAIPDVAIHEQRDVFEELHIARSRYAAVRTRLTLQIALLKERRQALITAAVTGGLDVTKGAA